MNGEQRLITLIEKTIEQEAWLKTHSNVYVREVLTGILTAHRKDTAEDGKPKCTCGRYGGHSPDCSVSKKKGGND